MALLNRETPAVGESLYGFLNRLATANRYGSALWLYDRIDLHPSERDLTEVKVRDLARLSGATADVLAKVAWIPNPSGFWIGNHLVPKWMVRRYCSAICIECLIEGRPHLAAWDFRPIMICCRHQARLIELCPVCHADLRRSRPKVSYCHRGHDLRRCRSAIEGIADRNLLAGVGILQGAVDGAALPFSSPLSMLGPVDIVLLGRLLGGLETGNLLKRSKNWGLLDETCAAVGLKLLRHWPKSLHRLLNQRRARGPHPLPFLDADVDRFIKGGLRRDRDLGYAAVLGAEIWGYAGAKGLILPPNNYLFTPPEFHNTYMTPTAAAGQMQIAPETVVRIAKSYHWSGYRQLGQKSTAWLLRADVDAWCAEAHSNVLLTEVARRLRCETKMVIDLIQHGCFGKAALNRVPADLRSTWYATSDELETFLVRLRPQTASSRAPGTTVKWCEFVHRRWNRGLTIGRVISEAFAGKISVVGWPSTRLTDICFDLNDLLRLQGAGTDHELLTLSEVKREFSVSWELIRKLRTRNLLVLHRSSANGKARLVRRQDARAAIVQVAKLRR